MRNSIFAAHFCILSAGFVYFARSDYSCGGNLNEKNRQFSSPRYPYQTEPKLICFWHFQPTTPPGPLLFIHFVDFALQNDDSLTIESGKGDVFSFSGAHVSFIVAVDPFSNVTLRTSSRSIGIDDDRKFAATFDFHECKEKVSDNSGVVSSPVYSVSNKSSVSFTCQWTISTSLTEKSFLDVSFAEFRLNRNSLSIYNDVQSSNPVANFTGNEIPPDTIVQSQQMVLVLKIQDSNRVAKFVSEFVPVLARCAKTIDVESAVTIDKSDLVPKPSLCVWLLRGPQKTTLSAELNSVNLLNVEDLLIFNDGLSRYSPNLRTFTSSSGNETSYASTSRNLLFISFWTAPIINQSTFIVNVTSQKSGGTYYDSGFFSLSPQQTHGEDVVFSLIVKTSLQIEVSVEAFNLQNSSEILFFDVGGTEQRLLAQFSRDVEFYPVFSSTNKMKVVARHFTGVETLNGNFRSIPAGCGVFDSNAIGSYLITSKDRNNCTWLIKPKQIVERGDVIALTITHLILSTSDSVTIYEGLSENDERLLRHFNSSLHEELMLYASASLGVRVDLRLGSESSTQNIAELIAFYEVQRGCNRDIALSDAASKVQVTSVGYPAHYLLNANCSWRISAPDDATLFINFVDVDIYPGHELDVYSVLTNKSRQLIASADGSAQPEDVIQQTSEILVTCNSTKNSGIRPARGFSLDISILKCGANLTSSSGIVTPPQNLTSNGSLECVWGIAIPTHPLCIVKFELKKDEEIITSTIRNSLEIHDGNSLNSPGLLFPEPNSSCLSRTNKLLVKYLATNREESHSTFTLTYSSEKCGNQLCKNGICMHSDWRCNGVNDCGDFSDEENCQTGPKKQCVSLWLFILTTVASLVVGLVLPFTILFAVRKIKSRREENANNAGFSRLSENTEEEDRTMS